MMGKIILNTKKSYSHKHGDKKPESVMVSLPLKKYLQIFAFFQRSAEAYMRK